jgi:hypothetical protein
MNEEDAGRDRATPASVRHDYDQPPTPIEEGGGMKVENQNEETLFINSMILRTAQQTPLSPPPIPHMGPHQLQSTKEPSSLKYLELSF